MHLTGKSKIVLAMLSIALLFFSPAGMCAGATGHPCCPQPACPTQQSPTMSCVCADGQPVATAAPAPAGEMQLASSPVRALPVHAAERMVRPGEWTVFSPQDRCLQFRQLLL